MKIGILTFHRANNFGAVLQAYALQQVLLNNNYDVEIIDYRNKSLENIFHNKSIKSKIKYFIKYFIYHDYIMEQRQGYKKFDDFRKNNIKLSRKYNINSISESNEVYDVFISGSDQVWNLWYVDCDTTFVLDFAKEEKRYSYAASFGGTYYANKYQNKILPEINKFRNLLVREHSAKKFLKDRLEVNSEVVVDPTFLIERNDWVKLIEHKEVKERYVLCYFVAPETYSLTYAKELAKEMKCKLICLMGKGDDKNILYINNAGPLDFLRYVYNAECVVTTSFHGLVFSMIFNTPFYYEMNHNAENNNDRLLELKNEFDLDKYEINSNVIKVDMDWNWEAINNKIKNNRAYSLERLYESFVNN